MKVPVTDGILTKCSVKGVAASPSESLKLTSKFPDVTVLGVTSALRQLRDAGALGGDVMSSCVRSTASRSRRRESNLSSSCNTQQH